MLTVKEGRCIDTLVVGVLVRRDIIQIDKTVLYDLQFFDSLLLILLHNGFRHHSLRSLGLRVSLLSLQRLTLWLQGDCSFDLILP